MNVLFSTSETNKQHLLEMMNLEMTLKLLNEVASSCCHPDRNHEQVLKHIMHSFLIEIGNK